MAKTGNIPTHKAAKERRRTQAAERQAVYDALPQDEKDRRNPNKVVKS